MTSRALALSLVLPLCGAAGLAWAQPSSQPGGGSMISGNPGGASQPGGGSMISGTPGGGGRSPALNAAYGTPSAGAQFTPDTTANPGYVDEPTESAPEQQYGSTARGVGPNGAEINGLQIYDEDLMPPETGYSEDVPDEYIVQQGDTLWDISGYYLQDPYQWPKLWSWNEHITNAHWIFPGDRIRLYNPSTGGRSGGGGGGPGGAGRSGQLNFSRTGRPGEEGPKTYTLGQIAFVDAEKFETAMKIIGGGSAKVMMATLDTVYLDYDKKHPPVPGERLVVYAPQKEVKDIERKKTLGYVVQIMGEVEVDSLARKAAEGTIRTSFNPIERGYRVGPLRRVFKKIETREAEHAASGLIVATLTTTGPIPIKTRNPRRYKKPALLVGEGDFVVTDLGKSSGVMVGNVLDVVRKGDQYTKKRVFQIPYEDGWPRRVIGQVLVVDVEAETSLGVVVESRREIERGDHVELLGRQRTAGGPSGGGPRRRVGAQGQAEGQAGGGKASGGARFKLGGN